MSTVGFCRELSVNEPMIGTAHAGATRWVVLEDTSPWGPKVPQDTGLPDHAKAWLRNIGDVPGTRVQLIRRPGTLRDDDRRKLFVVRSPAEPAKRRVVELDVCLDELSSLDPDALLDRATPAERMAELWLVCTHGARDRCCAKWGMALFEAMRSRGDATRVWQSSHIGGHRFAPTMLALPSGLCWGRVELDEVDEILARAAEARIGALAKLRGRSCYGPIEQAAECLVRRRESLDGDAELRVLGQSEHGTRVFAAGREFDVTVERVAIDLSTPSSCGDEPEPRTRLSLTPMNAVH